MLRNPPLLAAALVVSILSGCAGLATSLEPEETWYVTPKPGSKVEVKQRLSAGAGARVSLQHGRVLRWGDVYKLNPYCQFHILRPRGQLTEPVHIEPDTFTVEKVYRRKDVVKLAGVQYAFLGANEVDGSPSQRTMATYLELSSDAQPEVYRLVCARWDDPYDHNHVSIKEIRKSLGDLVVLVTN